MEDGDLDQSSQIIIRLQISAIPWRPLEADQVLAFGLDSQPAWVAEFYGPQPTPGSLWGLWRQHPKLDGRFLPDYADDLQVMVHDGGPRLTSVAPEVVWVRVTGMDAEVFRGRVLNQPDNLQSVRQGNEIKFLVAEGAEFPVMVTEKYLAERSGWRIDPCRRCGFSELFDAPSDLIRVVFPDMPADGQMRAFTAFCSLCGGVQLLRSRGKKFSKDMPPGKRPCDDSGGK